MRYEPQLATLVKEVPGGGDWLHEIKFDGYRIGCQVRRGRAQLISRNGKDWTARFGPVTEAAARLPVKSALLDGEVAIVLPDGRTSFQALQNALGGRAQGLTYFAFDLHELDGADLRKLPLEDRKAALRDLLGRTARGRGAASAAVLRYSDHVIGRGAAFFAKACESGLEGIVSKRRRDPHHAGRGPSWVKTKCTWRQELVIGGFTEPAGSRAGIGALLVGVFGEDGRLAFAGKVGTGFTQASAMDMRRRLEAIETDRCPFDPRPPGPVSRTARWVRPRLVAEVEFTEWTGDGKMRHPSFQGLRADKPAREVVREEPQTRTRRSAMKRI